MMQKSSLKKWDTLHADYVTDRGSNVRTLYLTLQNKAVLSGAAAFIIPIITYFISKKISSTAKQLLLFACVFVILCFTLLNRQANSEHSIQLTPFYSYRLTEYKGVQMQILMNIFLFIPFGFLMPLCQKKSFWITVIIGCLLSISIEALQYFFALGFCETDDVINNTLGTVIGCLYYKIVWYVTIRDRSLCRRDKSEEI